MTFNPNHHRKGGKFLKFELADPAKLVLVIAKDGEAKRLTITDPEEIASQIKKTQTTADGRLLGIWVKGCRERLPGGSALKRDANGDALLDPKTGEPLRDTYPQRWVEIPDCVDPQRAVLSPSGDQNLQWHFGGVVYTVRIPLDCLKNVEPIDLTSNRDDIPKHRRDTLNANFKPSK